MNRNPLMPECPSFYARSFVRLITRTMVLIGGSAAGVLGLAYAFA